MSEETIRHGVFEVTSVGKTQYYFAEDIGGAQDVLLMLNIIDINMSRAPKGSTIDVNTLFPRFEKALQGDRDLRQPIFEPLDQSAYESHMAGLTGGEASVAHYAINYDCDQFQAVSWDANRLARLSAPLSGMLTAYRSAMQFIDNVHYALDGRALMGAVDKIADVQTIQEGPSPGQITGPVM